METPNQPELRPAKSRALFPGALAGCMSAAAGIWPRICLIFLALCLVKLLLLAGLRKYLFETHWRASSEPLSWINTFVFCLFAVMVLLHLWNFGTRCRASNKRVMRMANMCIVASAAAFILLTLHEGNKNYLAPVMSHVLTWKDLGWYLVLDCFFRAPFLGAWIFVYGLVCYLLARTGRDFLILRVTAICGGLYVALCLQDFTKYYSALIIVDGIGLACLLSGWSTRQSLGWGWLASPLVGVILLIGLFYGLDPRLSFMQVNPEFALLSGTGLVVLAGVTFLAGRFKFWNAWSWMLPFACSAFLLFANVNYDAALNYHKLLCAGFALPRYFLGECALAAFLFALAVAYRRWRPAGSLLWLDFAGLLLITFGLADLRLAKVMGARLDWQALSLAWGETPTMMWRMARPHLGSLGAALLLTLGIYTLVLSVGRRKAQRLTSGAVPGSWSGPLFLLLCFLSLGLTGQQLLDRDKAQGQAFLVLARTSPWWRDTANSAIDEQTFQQMANSMGVVVSTQPSSSTAKPVRDANVVLVLQESSYNKYLSLFGAEEETQPMLSKYRERMEIFPNFFANFAGSIHARFAAFTGLYPVQDYQSFTLHRVGVRSLFELLHDQGYTCSLFYSSFFDYTGFRDFLKGRKLDEFYDADTMPGARSTKPVSWGLREEETLAAMQSQIKRYAAKGQKFFLTYIPAAPHHPYDGTPARFSKSKVKEIGNYTPLYLNELRYMDWIIASLIDQLRESGVLDETVVVITSDHGELLGADGGIIGHGWAVTPELANIPLIIMNGGQPGYRVNYTVGSQVDLLPTILDVLGLAPPPDQLCQGISLYSATAHNERTIYLNSFRQYGLIKGQYFFCGDRDTTAANAAKSVFTITNLGSRTYFSEVSRSRPVPGSIVAFDEFQAKLLRDYSEYCQILRGCAGKNVGSQSLGISEPSHAGRE